MRRSPTLHKRTELSGRSNISFKDVLVTCSITTVFFSIVQRALRYSSDESQEIDRNILLLAVRSGVKKKRL